MAANEPRRLPFLDFAREGLQSPVAGVTLGQIGLFVLSVLAVFVFLQEVETVIRLHTNLPYWDQWAVVADYDLLREGNFGLDGWFSQQSEHRPLVPRALFFGDLYLLGGQNYVPSVMGVVLQLTTAGFLAGAAFVLLRGRRGGAGLLVLFTALVVAHQFTTAQVETFIVPFQLVWTLGFTAAAGAFVLFVAAGSQLSGRKRFAMIAGAVALAAISHLSFQYGMWAWAVLLAIGALRGYPRRWLLPIAALGAALTAAFFYDYSTPQGTASFVDSLTHPLDFVDFVAIVLGGPVNALAGRTGARIVGAIAFAIVVGAVYLAVRRRHELTGAEILLLAVTAFAFLGVCHLSFIRAPLGVGDAEASRFVLLSAPLWTATVVLLWALAADRPELALPRRGAVVLTGGLVGIAAISPWYAVPPWRDNFSGLDRTTTAIRVGVYDNEALARIYPADGVDDIKPHIPILEKYSISVFRGQDPSELLGDQLNQHFGVATGICIGSFDTIQGVGDPNGASVSGWAWDSIALERPPLVVLAGEDRVIVGIGDALDERIDVLSNVPGVTDVNSGWFGYSRRSDGDATAYAILDGRVACPLPGEYPISP
jgi:hypothetical protein